MSRWKALAAARDVADVDLRDRLVDALETLHVVAAALRGCEDMGDVRPTERSMLEAVAELEGVWEEAQRREEAADEREAAAETAFEQSQELRAEIEELNAEIHVLQDRLDAATPLLDAYSDLLARARTFVTFAEKSGVKARHVRAVPGTGTPTKDKSATRRKGRKQF